MKPPSIDIVFLLGQQIHSQSPTTNKHLSRVSRVIEVTDYKEVGSKLTTNWEADKQVHS